jgi:hypothetical protein
MTFSRKLSESFTGTETWFHADGEGNVTIETRQDIAAILEANKRLRNEFEGYQDKGDHHFHHYATIPAVVIEMWRNQYGVDVFDPDHAGAVKRLLNDGDWRALRTTEGTV